jgi:hypothetical protein
VSDSRSSSRDEVYVRITENRRLATAAAAITQRIVILSKPLVFLPVLPVKKGSTVVAIVIGVSVEGGKWLENVILHICLFAEAVASAEQGLL